MCTLLPSKVENTNTKGGHIGDNDQGKETVLHSGYKRGFSAANLSAVLKTWRGRLGGGHGAGFHVVQPNGGDEELVGP